MHIRDASKTPVKWLAGVDTFKQPRSFEFKPGLNILWGRNGSGKTSLIKILTRLFHCEQSNQPVVTEESLRKLTDDDFRQEPNDIRMGLQIEHDGQGVRHFDPGHAVGLIGGMAGFDWDFGASGLSNAMFRGSAGQTTLFRFNQLAEEIVARSVPKVSWKVPHERAGKGTWGQRVTLAAHFLESNAPKGQPTLLLDEPERSYDLNTQIGIWRFLRAYSDQVQFIVASHSLFALKIPEANYIELSPAYLAGAEKALEILQKWPAEKPPKVSKGKTMTAKDGVKKRKRIKAHDR
jgi:ABC-type Mn2+/Zn2+ transport system ATPase subunit